MCLAIPMKLISIDNEGGMGVAEYKGVRKKIDLSLLEGPLVGDYLLVHTGFAIQKIDEEEFKKTMEIIEQEADIREELQSDEIDLETTQPQLIPFENFYEK